LIRHDDDPWRGVVAPYRMLDPALRAATGTALLPALVAALPDEEAAAATLNEALARPSLIRGRSWQLSLDPPLALGLLVVAGGWHRLKRCRCGRPFIDRTAGATRLHCSAHLRRPGHAR
jgi:predicted RNA-binding Zn ribbon-like protein